MWTIAKNLDAAFLDMDEDGNGVLTPEEFVAAFGAAVLSAL